MACDGVNNYEQLLDIDQTSGVKGIWSYCAPNLSKLPPEVGNTVGKVNLVVTKKGLRTNLKPLFIKLVAGAGFEPATFGL